MDILTPIRGTSKHEVTVAKAEELVKLVEAGVSVNDATAEIGTSSRGWQARARLNELNDWRIVDAAERRQILIDSMMKIMLTAEEAKDAVAAARVLTGDPDLGFSGGAPLVAVTFSDETLKLDGKVEWGK